MSSDPEPRPLESTLPRPAESKDAKHIRDLLNKYAEEHLLLPRTLSDIKKHLETFTVVEKDGEFAGCVAFRKYGRHLFEVRSLAVMAGFEGLGLGSALVRGAVERLRREHPGCTIFALTYRPQLFKRLGFQTVSKNLFPEKIWSDCAECAKRNHCDEEAVMLGA